MRPSLGISQEICATNYQIALKNPVITNKRFLYKERRAMLSMIVVYGSIYRKQDVGTHLSQLYPISWDFCPNRQCNQF